LGAAGHSAPLSPRLRPAGMGVAWAIVCGLGLLPLGRRGEGWLAMLGVALLTLLLLLAGCGSGRSTPPRSSAGKYTVTITGTGMSSGALSASSASTTFAITID
jgi:hypothetical protein